MDCAQCALSCGSAGEWWLSCEECSCVRRTFGGCGVRRSRSPSQIISSLKESPRLALLIQHDLIAFPRPRPSQIISSLKESSDRLVCCQVCRVLLYVYLRISRISPNHTCSTSSAQAPQQITRRCNWTLPNLRDQQKYLTLKFEDDRSPSGWSIRHELELLERALHALHPLCRHTNDLSVTNACSWRQTLAHVFGSRGVPSTTRRGRHVLDLSC